MESGSARSILLLVNFPAAVVHVTPFRDVEVELLIGQPLEVAPPKERRDDRRGRRDDREKSHVKDGDWTCPKCRNHNFAWRENCNRCDAPKGDAGGNSRPRRDHRGGTEEAVDNVETIGVGPKRRWTTSRPSGW
ncbi:MAG: hypothetical protein Ct9H90mP16_19170 [Candidatus Poseidoniales archaeon]|nr:MAG: hypothetical protein Ct9H90mP16_19170 [Candidatus Poseidoniales archaeon]